jgi:lysophospholipase L1-like esterase
VTFGFLLANEADTFPYQVERLLEDHLDREVETINAGVGGYSPWQEYRYFADEGLKYNPDLVIVSFVLNDVTEKFELARFGGRWEGYQVAHTAFSRFDAWASRSSIIYFLKQIGIKIRHSGQSAALVQEKLDVEMLAYQPTHPDIERAWELTLTNLAQIFDLANDYGIPVVLVVFPFTFQFEDVVGTSAPQQKLVDFAQAHQVPVFDLLPHLSVKMKAAGAKPDDYFLDEDHPSVRGSAVIAEMIAAFLMEGAIPLTRSTYENKNNLYPNHRRPGVDSGGLPNSDSTSPDLTRISAGAWCGPGAADPHPGDDFSTVGAISQPGTGAGSAARHPD